MKLRLMTWSCVVTLGLGCGGAGPNNGRAPKSATAPHPQVSSQNEAPVLVPGVDASRFSAEDGARWQALLHELKAPCSEATSLAMCLKKPLGCAKDCARAGRYAARLTKEGYADRDIAELHGLRFDPKARVEIQTSEAPSKGAADASVTIVVFSDFECPYCAVAAAVLDQLLAQHSGKLRVVMKHFPLPQHDMAFEAAKAAVAAGLQNQFWPMHDAIYRQQTQLSTSFFDKQAKAIGINVTQFRKDMRLDSTEARVKSDTDEATRLGIRGTPTLFVNGRYYAEPLESLPMYLDEMLAP
ncbi:MAG: thioredoxin domain-containing protein [Myxococcales bacterium]|nr:thioredoxin domain-containing protein [Myxococcales bacterium]MCB9708403.1 thioredoxin domain-containing protein [Myxococcales bacterium]